MPKNSNLNATFHDVSNQLLQQLVNFTELTNRHGIHSAARRANQASWGRCSQLPVAETKLAVLTFYTAGETFKFVGLPSQGPKSSMYLESTAARRCNQANCSNSGDFRDSQKRLR